MVAILESLISAANIGRLGEFDILARQQRLHGAGFERRDPDRGRGGYRIEQRTTVLAAMDPAREIEQDPRAHTRRALIYAIAPDGHATLLTAALIAKLLSLR
ncbi:hypothetical protein [Bradyrhizobium sp. WSM1743]|uniref:hypothetical protein n=1 Tax=Bradyrhizobium sp. WSM1743 TaxID=318996 RepID=UPI0004239E39|nr:hypothetical protein [Bradyrhizobium sp. WSM1743]